ncbi:MAG: HAD family phosphatase [Lachnospiraceae bacterium]|jgi:beta-phosphoglucomutase-like phosphatase (HAD superfamily)|nr:HAD family phosphatase [Lachnospiraceae bacterium]
MKHIEIDRAHGWRELKTGGQGFFETGKKGVEEIVVTGDGKVELIGFAEETLAYVKSDMGYPAFYPLRPVSPKKPVKAVLMDLDGTTVRSEEFWIWIIERTVASLVNDEGFTLEEEDIPYVSGHSVSEHLQYCIKKYAPDAQLERARAFYTEHTDREMEKILAGRGREGAFTPAPGIKEFLMALKAMGVAIALVTSGLFRKAYPEILSAFDTLDMGDPKEFYDCIITAGDPLMKGGCGTMGELEAKPHPWLYAEACRVGLGIAEADRESVVGIEDSGAGVCSLRLGGFYTIGLAGGNIVQSGTLGMCNAYCESFAEILDLIKTGDPSSAKQAPIR